MATISHPTVAPASSSPRFRLEAHRPPITAAGLRHAAENVLLGVAFFAAAWPNLRSFDRSPADFIWAVGAVVIAVLSMVRVPPRVARVDLEAFAATAAMLAMPALMRRGVASAGFLQLCAVSLELMGTALSQVARIFMGRRFGVLPANRGIVSHGPFRVIRHPIYAGWLMLSAGYALAYPSWRNFAILLVTLPAALWRIHIEEELLLDDPEYRVYRDRVRFMLIPRML